MKFWTYGIGFSRFSTALYNRVFWNEWTRVIYTLQIEGNPHQTGHEKANNSNRRLLYSKAVRLNEHPQTVPFDHFFIYTNTPSDANKTLLIINFFDHRTSTRGTAKEQLSFLFIHSFSKWDFFSFPEAEEGIYVVRLWMELSLQIKTKQDKQRRRCLKSTGTGMCMCMCTYTVRDFDAERWNRGA